ncbi:hypothetical protein ABHF91_08855 [Pseudaeromonas sp. ZJS20]|uniref:hypothetical protein n=1 Tax=Pseudaeromonas aegiceratis TaxID=3153928 RepID=UPI00390C8D44
MTLAATDYLSSALTPTGVEAGRSATSTTRATMPGATASASIPNPGVLLVDPDAVAAAARLRYDQPSGRESRAVAAYQTVARQERREQVQSLIQVDLYA